LAKGSDYIWPVKGIKVSVTSVLNDKRSGHPHGGIDISLFGKVGTVPIVSVADGLLMRIRTSTRGYGNALYIRMADKRVAVYAHLDHFSPRIKAVADSLSKSLGTKYLDYYYEEWEMDFAVRKGEIIGYGGKTGTSTSHLHFELRYDDLVNLNPLTNGFPITDDISPALSGIMFTPIDSGSTVNGKGQPIIINKSKMSNTKTDPIKVFGRVGLSVDAYDSHVPKGRKFSPYKIEINIDDKPYFYTRYESWGYLDKNIWMTQYDLTPVKKDRFLRVYNPYPVKIPFFSHSDSGTFDNIPPGKHKVTVKISDANSNYHAGNIYIKVINNPNAGKRHWPKGEGKQLLFNEKTVLSKDGGFSLIGQANSFFEPIKLTISGPIMWDQGRCYKVKSPKVYLRQLIEVRFKYENVFEDVTNIGVYRKDGNALYWLGNDIDLSRKTVTGASGRISDFCVMEDSEPPKIFPPKGNQKNNRRFSFRITDDLSGLEKNFVLVTVDGKFALVDYSKRKETVLVETEKPFFSGRTRNVIITAIDRAGNIAEKSFDL